MSRPVGSTNKPKLISWAGTERDPATYIAKVMQDEEAPAEQRLKAAVALLPYVHRRLPTELDIGGTSNITITAIERQIIDVAESGQASGVTYDH